MAKPYRSGSRAGARWLVCSLLLAIPLAAPRAAEPLDFPLQPLEGEQQTLADYRGQWVVVNYWATWCPPCRKEIPELDLFNEKRSDAVVLGINLEDIPLSRLKQFVGEQFIDYPIFHQRPRWDTPFGRLSGLPTTFVVTPDGVPVAVQSGGITSDRLERFIDHYRASEKAAARPPTPR